MHAGPNTMAAHLRSACRLMPVEAASEMMAMCLSPSMNEFFSVMLTIFWLSSAHRTCNDNLCVCQGKVNK